MAGKKLKIINSNKGAITILVVVFGSVFLVLFSGLFGFILTQMRQNAEKIAWSEALNIAEAGSNYYRWCLNNGIEGSCLLEKDYLDPSGDHLGRFSININLTASCGQTIQKEIVSTGWTDKYPQVKRKVSVLYARASVAKYSYILNRNVWADSSYEINGQYHSNAGIRMDGENLSTVSSAKSTWVCTRGSFGCSPCPTSHGCTTQHSRCICPGVFTTTSNAKPDLFSFPVPPFDFNGIKINLAQMKSAVQTSGGIYLEPSINKNSHGKGYHLKFFKDPVTNEGKFEVWIITSLSSTYGYGRGRGHGHGWGWGWYHNWHYDQFIISNEYLYGTYVVPSSCSAIFIEDNLWVEGTVKGKVTVASANLLNPNVDTDIILPTNINYAGEDGSDGLTLIAERNIFISPNSPNNMILKGIFISQKGAFGLNNYNNNLKDSLQIYGSVISSSQGTSRWTSGSQVISGYRSIENYFDTNLIYSPPPFTPFIEPNFGILRWQEM